MFTPDDLRAFTVAGARQTLIAILEEFPELFAELGAAPKRQSVIVPDARESEEKVDGRRRGMTPAQRKAVSLRMRASWAKRKAAKEAANAGIDSTVGGKGAPRSPGRGRARA